LSHSNHVTQVVLASEPKFGYWWNTLRAAGRELWRVSIVGLAKTTVGK